MDIFSSTVPVGLIGHPVEHSFSPVLHNAIYRKYGLDYFYLAFDVREEMLADAVNGLKALGFAGFNVTIPYKQKIIPLLDEVDRDASAVGAVNTVSIEEGRLKGYNTDGMGFVDSLRREGFFIKGCTAVILGSGGAARAIVVYLIREGADQIYILNRTREKALALKRDLERFYKSARVEIIDRHRLEDLKVDLLVNTTPVGMWPEVEASPLPDYEFDSSMTVVDIIYNPRETLLLKKARKAGCRTVNGIGMLVGQAIRAIEIWTGLRVDYDECMKVLGNCEIV